MMFGKTQPGLRRQHHQQEGKPWTSGSSRKPWEKFGTRAISAASTGPFPKTRSLSMPTSVRWWPTTTGMILQCSTCPWPIARRMPSVRGCWTDLEAGNAWAHWWMWLDRWRGWVWGRWILTCSSPSQRSLWCGERIGRSTTPTMVRPGAVSWRRRFLSWEVPQIRKDTTKMGLSRLLKAA